MDIAKLAKALGSFQSELPSVEKDCNGHNYKYASLDACMEAIKPLLHKYELALSQPIISRDGALYVRTILMHSSGQYIESECPCQLNTADRMNAMQKVGSSITYARRYSLSIVGLTTDEDVDGDTRDTREVKKRQPPANSPPLWTLQKLKAACYKLCDNNKEASKALWESMKLDESVNYDQRLLQSLYYQMKTKVSS